MRPLPSPSRSSRSGAWRGAAALLCAFGVLGAAGSAASQSLQPSGWDTGVRLPEAADTNPDPRVVEVDLDARVAEVEIEKGARVQAWTYNGGIPGPLIHSRLNTNGPCRFITSAPKTVNVGEA